MAVGGLPFQNTTNDTQNTVYRVTSVVEQRSNGRWMETGVVGPRLKETSGKLFLAGRQAQAPHPHLHPATSTEVQAKYDETGPIW